MPQPGLVLRRTLLLLRAEGPQGSKQDSTDHSETLRDNPGQSVSMGWGMEVASCENSSSHIPGHH